MGSLSEEAILPFSLLFPFSNQAFAPLRIKFFLVRVDPILKGRHHPGKRIGSHKNVSLSAKRAGKGVGREGDGGVPYTLKSYRCYQPAR